LAGRRWTPRWRQSTCTSRGGTRRSAGRPRAGAAVDAARTGGAWGGGSGVRRGPHVPDAGDDYGSGFGRDFPRRGGDFSARGITLVLAGLWTIPVGVYVGLRPRMAAVAQPIAQIAASVPATALFPIVLLALIRVGGAGRGLLCAAAAGHAVVHPVQCDRRRQRHPDRSQGGLRRLPDEPGGTLEEAVSCREFPLPGDGIRHRLGRRLERQHRGPASPRRSWWSGSSPPKADQARLGRENSKSASGSGRKIRRAHRRADEARRRSCDWSRERFTLDPGFRARCAKPSCGSTKKA
jgi:hypothetical protein